MTQQNFESLNSIPRLTASQVDELAASLKDPTPEKSAAAGLKLARDAARYGIGIKEYLLLSIGKEESKIGLNGYEQMLYKLNLPTKNDFENGVFLQAASETFQTHPGTRALFPEVIDDVIRFSSRQDEIERVAPMLANSRTIAGPELLSTVIDMTADQIKSFAVAELGRIPIRTISTSETSVKIYKHGSGIQTSYEFGRRASLDLLTPHANRIQRDLELSKVLAATSVIINGDGVNAAATIVNQSDYDGEDFTGYTAVNGKINWPHLLYWLVTRAQNKTPVDTILMNWDGLFQWTMMFGAPTEGVTASGTGTSAFGPTATENLNKAGVQLDNFAIGLFKRITPVLSSGVPAGKIVGFSRGDTLEELVEAGSIIQETERNILNQSVMLVRTENTGYKLVYGDTRSVFIFNE